MKKIATTLAVVSAAALMTACGGGGGSSGAVSAEYQITLRADKNQLPVNIDNYPVGNGAYRPFTTTLYVNATINGQPIPGGEKVFGCNMDAGLNSSSLYYLDGDPEHEEEKDDPVTGEKIKIPLAYRQVVLDANSGGATFHFHAGNQVGTSRITCTVTDPRDGQQKAASVEISVGQASGKPASVRLVAAVPGGYLGVRGNTNGLLSQMALQGFVMDDANQPTASTSGANLQVRILQGTDAARGARLAAGAQTSTSVLQLPSIGGVATFSMLSGSETGPVFLELAADRFDNNVSNGILDPIVAIYPVPVLEALTGAPSIDAKDLGEVTKGVPITAFLDVSGGLPPYTWSATGLPKGLAVDSVTGVISGKVAQDAEEREYQATVTVVDKNKYSASATVKMKVVGGLPEDFAIGDCNSNEVCSLGTAVVQSRFAYSFVASVKDVTWEFAGLPGWLSGSTSGTAGVLNGTPAVGDCGASNFVVTAKKGAASVTRRFSLRVVSGSTPGHDPATGPDPLTCPN